MNEKSKQILRNIVDKEDELKKRQEVEREEEILEVEGRHKKFLESEKIIKKYIGCFEGFLQESFPSVKDEIIFADRWKIFKKIGAPDFDTISHCEIYYKGAPITSMWYCDINNSGVYNWHIYSFKWSNNPYSKVGNGLCEVNPDEGNVRAIFNRDFGHSKECVWSVMVKNQSIFDDTIVGLLL